jgi:hypothetical protein
MNQPTSTTKPTFVYWRRRGASHLDWKATSVQEGEVPADVMQRMAAQGFEAQLERPTLKPAPVKGSALMGFDFTGCGSVSPVEVAAVESVARAMDATGTVRVTRRSHHAFDFRINGTYRTEHGNEFPFSAWFPLLAIRELTQWTKLARESDYPQMVVEGDWSGIRDSGEAKIWAMFNSAVLAPRLRWTR